VNIGRESDTNMSESDEECAGSSDSDLYGYYDDDDGDEIDLETAANAEYMTSEQVLTMMKEQISEIKKVIEQPESETKQLLNYFEWDNAKLLESYFEKKRTRYISWQISPTRA
jgi:hypothetical protein